MPRDYSGGGTTDWVCHTFGGFLFALNLHLPGPTEIIPPNDQYRKLVFKFATGQTIHHGGGCVFGCQVRRPAGSKLEGLQYEAR